MPPLRKEIKLKVAEAIQDDVNKGIVRIDSTYMHQIDCRPGDIVEIEGERLTVGITDRAYPGDIGLNIIRIDGLIRRNAKTSISDFVTVRKADIKESKKVVIAPARKGIMIRANPIIFKQGLLGRPVVKGDIVSLGGQRRRRTPGMGANPFVSEVFNMLDENMIGFGLGDLKFIVSDALPKGSVIITENTIVEFNPEAAELKEEKLPEVAYEDIGGLEEEVRKVREMVELPLKHPEIFERLGIEPPKGVLLHGPPGTGKTLLAKAVASETNSNFILINGPEIMSKYYGQSEENLRKKFEEAEKNAPSIIFIDEIDAIASKREESKGEVERRVVAQLLAIMDGLKTRGKVVVIAATNIPNSLDPALRRPGRFDREIEIGVPSRAGRLNILKIHTRGMPLFSRAQPEMIERVIRNIIIDTEQKPKESEFAGVLPIIKNLAFIEQLKKTPENIEIGKDINVSDYENKLNIEIQTVCNAWKISSEKTSTIQQLIRAGTVNHMLAQFADITHGFVGADLISLAKEAAMNVIRLKLPELKVARDDEPIPQELLEKLVISTEDFKEALKVVRPSALREVMIEVPNVTWQDVGGLEKVKQEIRETVEWPITNKASFARLGIKPPKGVLLYGPPGTGKTLLAKAVATEAQSNFIVVKGPELLSKWVGESEKAVRKIFEKARQTAPTIVFFDEIDSMAPKRGLSSDSGVTERVVNQLLTEIDGLQELNDIVIIGATNRPDIMDSALLRPGRFDRIIHVGAPDIVSRTSIFSIHTSKMPIKWNSIPGNETQSEDEEIEKELKGLRKVSNNHTDHDIKKMASDEAIQSATAKSPSEPLENTNGILTNEGKITARGRFLYQLAKKTEGYVGADIESVCREAAILALRENSDVEVIEYKYFVMALDKVRASVTKEIEELYADMEKTFRSARANEMRDNKPSYYG